MSEISIFGAARIEEVRATLALPVAADSARAEFPPIDTDLGEARMHIATDNVFRREYATLHPAEVDEVATGVRGIMGALRQRRKVTAPKIEGDIVTRLCDPFMADLTEIIWRDVKDGRPSVIEVADRSPVSNDSRRLAFGPRQRIVLDAASGAVTASTVEYMPGTPVKDNRPREGANLFEWANIIERSRGIRSAVLDDVSVHGRNYTREDVFAIVGRRMGHDWFTQ